MTPGPLTFTAFAAQVGPAPDPPRPEKVGKDGMTPTQRWSLRMAALFLGFGAIAMAAATGLDGTLKMLGGAAIGFGLGFSQHALERILQGRRG